MDRKQMQTMEKQFKDKEAHLENTTKELHFMLEWKNARIEYLENEAARRRKEAESYYQDLIKERDDANLKVQEFRGLL